MVGLKQRVLLTFFYTLTFFVIIKCECNETINEFHPNMEVCYRVKYYHSVYFDQLLVRLRMPANEFFNYAKCRNENITEKSEFMNRYTQYFDISNSIISSFQPFEDACVLELNNITMNISSTVLLNETYLQSLSIKSSNLSSFNFAPMSSLKILDLSDNKLTSLNTPNFRNFNLDILNVSSNRLSNIYCENVKLQLDLSKNNFDMIDCKFATSLKRLYLNNNNLRNISKDAFKGMNNLRALNLSDNQLNEVSLIFSDLGNLTRLNLNNNNIYRLEFGCFSNLKLLKYLNLSYNEIGSLSHGIFNGLVNLEVLDLSYNVIFKLDVGIFYSSHILRQLYLEGNFLQDLNMNILTKYNNLSKISFTFDNISCHKLKKYIDTLEENGVEVKKGTNYFVNNINGIECIGTSDLFKYSFELSLNALMKIHMTLTIITSCFLLIMILFVVIQYYRYKL